MAHDKLRQGANLSLAILQPVIALLVNLGVTGPSIGAVSDRYPTYVVPAGYAFSIWNLIFALTLGYGIWQARPQQRANPLLRRVGWWTAAALAATSSWMLVFQRSYFVLSVAVIFGLLLALIGVLARLYQHDAPLSQGERWLVYVAFSLFLGWVTVATIANVGQTLVAYGWSGWGLAAETWGLIALLLAGAVAAVVTVATQGNVPFALAVIWALVGVAVNQFSGELPTRATVVGAMALCMVCLVGLSLLVRAGNAPRLLRSEPSTGRHLT